MTWKPKKGDTVKLMAVKSWGGNKGQPILVRRAKVTKVSQSGYVSIDARPHDRFQTVEADVEHIAREWSPKKLGTPDYIKHIEPISVEEAEQLPDTDQGGREYARNLNPKET